MIAFFKRFSMAITFLLIMSFVMLLGTWGVTVFGEKMFEDSGVTMQPRGESINK